MHCPFCRHTDSRVIDSRTADDGLAIRRRRQCPQCGRRFTTVETASLSVLNAGREVTCSLTVNGKTVRQRSGAGLTICSSRR